MATLELEIRNNLINLPTNRGLLKTLNTMYERAGDYSALLSTGVRLARYFEIDLTKDIIEFPICCLKVYEDTVGYITNIEGNAIPLIKDNVERIIVPLPCPEEDTPIGGLHIIRNMPTLLKSVVNCNIVRGLNKVKSTANKIYYLQAGLILDENFKPLLMTSFTYKLSDPSYAIKTLYVDPSILLDATPVDIIRKSILKSVIPAFINMPEGPSKYRIILQDTSDKIIRPSAPNVDTITAELNQILADNAANIAEDVRTR